MSAPFQTGPPIEVRFQPAAAQREGAPTGTAGELTEDIRIASPIEGDFELRNQAFVIPSELETPESTCKPATTAGASWSPISSSWMGGILRLEFSICRS